MPADYNSTARALALPVSPPRSPTTTQQSYRAPLPWGRRSLSSSAPKTRLGAPAGSRHHDAGLEVGTGNMVGGRTTASLRDRTINNVERVWRNLLKTAEKMTPLQQALTFVLGVAVIVSAILFLVFSEKIFAVLEPIAEKWKSLRGGWLILWAMTFVTAFPPVIGYSTCLTLAGFVYGFPGGWPIVATATIVGSTCSFIASRTLLASFVERLVARDRRFEALSLVLKHDGLKLLVMIRLCPLPYSLSNGAISTFPTVQPLMFALATAAATPRLFIAVFIGSRLKAIAKSGEKMDAATKAINWASIIFGVLLGAGTGWLIYKRTLARSRQLENEERMASRDQAPGAGDFSDMPDEEADAVHIQGDQIDFLASEDAHEAYRDEGSDDGAGEDVFKYGDGGDEEQAIGMDKQLPPRAK